MAFKKTIGLIGYQNVWVKRLAHEYRLLLFPAVQEAEEPYPKEVAQLATEIEVVDRAKEGCWEADTVLISGKAVAPPLLEKIKEVVTQKAVMVLGENTGNVDDWKWLETVRDHLPLAKVVGVLLDTSGARAFIEGENPEAIETAQSILRIMGFGESPASGSILKILNV